MPSMTFYLVGQPAVSWGPNRLDIFGLGTDNGMLRKSWDGSQWLPSPTDWERWGPLSSVAPPIAVAWGPNRLESSHIATANLELPKNCFWPASND